MNPCDVAKHLGRWMALMGLLFVGSTATGQSNSPSPDDGVAWLIEQLADSDLQTRRDAAWALADLGPSAAPAVSALASSVDDDDTQVRNGALQALGRIGSAAEPALPVIAAQLRERDSQRRYRAAYALGRAAPSDSPLFVEGLNDSSASLRAATVQAVGWMDEPPESLIAEVAKRLSDADAEVVSAAQSALLKLGARSLKSLAERVNHDDAVTQQRAAETLGLIAVPVDAGLQQRLLELCQSSNTSVHAAALTALVATSSQGTSVQDAIEQALHHSNPLIVTSALSGVISRRAVTPDAIPQLLEHVDSSPEIAQLAAMALGRLGPEALPTVPLMLRKLTPENESRMIPAISGLGPDAIDAVFLGAAEGHVTIDQAAEIMARMGRRAVVMLEPALQHTRISDRAIAAQAIGRVRQQPDTVDFLTPLLEDASAQVRAAAAAGLANLGPLAKPVQARLRDIADDADPAVRAQSVTALAAIGAAHEEITPVIVQALKDESVQVRRQSAIALGHLDEINIDATNALIAALADVDSLVRQRSAETLGRTPETAGAAASALVILLQDSEPLVALSAAQALARVDQLDAEAVAALLMLLEHPSVDLRRTVITALGSGGDPARQASDRIIPFQHDDAPEVRAAAYRTLAALASSDTQRLEGLVAGLDDSDWTVRREIAEALGELGERAAGAVPKLLEMMRRDTDGETASAALRRIDTAPAEAIPLLLEILQDSDSDRRHRFYALYLLRKSGPAAQTALPTLRQLRDASEGRIRDSYDRAIREIER